MLTVIEMKYYNYFFCVLILQPMCVKLKRICSFQNIKRLLDFK
jgi:hypothetical protein